MKIAWFTPFGKRSAIGRVSQNITNLLSKHAEVHLWIPEVDAQEIHDTALTKVHFTTLDQNQIMDELIHKYDFSIYSMGDNFNYHGEIYEILRRVPGIVILHDFVMHHFFFGLFYQALDAPDLYVSCMEHVYGESGRMAAELSLTGKRTPSVWDSNEVTSYPLFEILLENARGAIVHSNFFYERVAKVFHGPLVKLNLPVLYSPATIKPNKAEHSEVDIPSERIMLLTVGMVNENKRIHTVLEALKNNPALARKAYYVIAGSYDHNQSYHSRLERLIDQGSLAGTVHFTGYLEDQYLQALLERADVCINLRHPAMEGASASLVEQLSYGKPVIVADTGFYSELPNSCVIKIDPNHEEADLVEALSAIIDNADLRREKGMNAKAHAESEFTIENYVQQLLPFLETTAMLQPIYDLTDSMAKKLKMLTVCEDAAILNELSEIILSFTTQKT